MTVRPLRPRLQAGIQAEWPPGLPARHHDEDVPGVPPVRHTGGVGGPCGAVDLSRLLEQLLRDPHALEKKLPDGPLAGKFPGDDIRVLGR